MSRSALSTLGAAAGPCQSQSQSRHEAFPGVPGSSWALGLKRAGLPTLVNAEGFCQARLEAEQVQRARLVQMSVGNPRMSVSTVMMINESAAPPPVAACAARRESGTGVHEPH